MSMRRVHMSDDIDFPVVRRTRHYTPIIIYSYEEEGARFYASVKISDDFIIRLYEKEKQLLSEKAK